MIRATLDANVIVSGFPVRQGVPADLIERWLGREFALALSEHILDGISRAWANRYYRVPYPEDEARQALALLRRRALIVDPMPTLRGVADDEEDGVVLATAVAGNADYLVTGDRGLLVLGSFRGIVIVTPRQFLDLLDAARDEDD